MRQKRTKAYRKLMHVYSMSFGFRQPYQVLVDSEMCSDAVSSKIDLPKQLATVLQGSVKLMITQCSIHALYLAGREAQPAVDLAKMFERRRCNHREAIPEEDCLRGVIGSKNAHRYVLAAQPTSLRQHIRQVPGTPIIHINRSVMILEPASEATERVKFMMEDDRMRPTNAEASTIASTLASSSKTGDGTIIGENSAPPKKKPRGPKGPNPLSVKKKKSKDSDRRPATKNLNSEVPKQSEAVREKRKRDDNDDMQKGDEATKGEVGIQVGTKRSRKRHRKQKGEDDGTMQVGDDDVEG